MCTVTEGSRNLRWKLNEDRDLKNSSNRMGSIEGLYKYIYTSEEGERKGYVTFNGK